MDNRESVDVSLIGGNASTELKKTFFDVLCGRAKTVNAAGIRGFEYEIASRVVWKEMSVVNKADEPEKLEGRTVFEITVEDDMVNPLGALHGGCSGLLIDNCSTMPMALLCLATTGHAEFGVSQSLNILYHAPAMLGARLRIIGTTVSGGNRTMSSRCEIWDATNHRLVASGVHTKMPASAPKPANKPTGSTSSSHQQKLIV